MRSSSPCVPRSHAGFTLIEVMVTLLVSLVLIRLAAPMVQNFSAGRSVSASVDDLGTAMRLARSEALKRGVSVAVCSTANPDASSPSCATSASWLTGWLMFTDLNSDGSIGTGDAVIQVFRPRSGVTSITEANSATSVVFRSSGLAAGRQFTLRPNVPSTNAEYNTGAGTVCVSATGRTQVSKGVVSC